MFAVDFFAFVAVVGGVGVAPLIIIICSNIGGTVTVPAHLLGPVNLVIRYSEGTIRIYNTVLLYVDMVNMNVRRWSYFVRW
jgi:hypothetical protein